MLRKPDALGHPLGPAGSFTVSEKGLLLRAFCEIPDATKDSHLTPQLTHDKLP